MNFEFAPEPHQEGRANDTGSEQEHGQDGKERVELIVRGAVSTVVQQ